MTQTPYSIVVDENLFASILAELSFRKKEEKTSVTYHQSSWGKSREEDERGWWLSVSSDANHWAINLHENDSVVVYEAVLSEKSIDWEKKIEIQEQIRERLTQQGKEVLRPPEIWWGIAPGKSRNSYYPFALKNGVVGIGFHIWPKKKIGEDFDYKDSEKWNDFEQYVKDKFNEEKRPSLACNKSIAFLNRIRKGDKLVLLKGTSPIWIGTFSGTDILTIQENEINRTKYKHVFRAVSFESIIDDIDLEAKDEKWLEKNTKELKEKTEKWLSEYFSKLGFDYQGGFTGNTLDTPCKIGRFSQSYTHNDNDKTLYCDFIEQRALVLDPISYSLLEYLKNSEPFMNDIETTSENVDALYEEEFSKHSESMELSATSERIHQTLKRHRSIILEGVPGTGKTHQYSEIRKKFDPKSVRFLTFHPSSDYSNFIGGLQPIEKNNQLLFEEVSGHLLELLKFAHTEQKDVLLWIDEVNRANLSKVFGELISLLGTSTSFKPRIKNVGLSESEIQSLFDKKNLAHLHIVGTMNTSDRSVTPMDAAMRRRFKFIRLEPYNDADINRELPNLDKKDQEAFVKISELLVKHLGEDHCLGHSYLYDLQAVVGQDQKRQDIWQYSILPNIIDSLMLTYNHENKHLLTELNKIVPFSLQIEPKGTGNNIMLLVTAPNTSNNITDDIVRLLCSRKNVVLEGVPGTGKTYQKDQIQKLSPDRELKIEEMTFHPSTAYEDFIGGLVPKIIGQDQTQELGFEYEEGILYKLAKEALFNPDKDFLLFIDEINRANIPKVMGEVLTLLENSKRVAPKRQDADSDRNWDEMIAANECDWTINLQSHRQLILPSNLYILATLNTSDRSVISMDSALRRRFAYYRLEPISDMSKLPSTMDKSLFEIWKNINNSLETYIGPDAMLGHSYLFDFKKYNDLKELFELSLLPQLADILNATAPSDLKALKADIEKELPAEVKFSLCLDKEGIVFVKRKQPFTAVIEQTEVSTGGDSK